MKKATYEIITESGNTYRFTFQEHHHEDTYGNGNYISVICNKELLAYVDVRYIKYVFNSFCESYIKQYYGENLFKYTLIESEDNTDDKKSS